MNDEGEKLYFEWDPAKAAANSRKHRVTFDEAETTFGDPRSLDVFDPDHSEAEDRFIKLGRSRTGRVLIVVYTQQNLRIRLISARRANRNERTRYEE